MKYKYHNISTMRTFDESPAKLFMVNGQKTTRKDAEKMVYADLKKMIKNGKVMSITRK